MRTLIFPTLKNVAGADSSMINGTVSNIVPVMPDDAAGTEGWFHDRKQKKLFVNFGGRVPGKDVKVDVAKYIEGVDAQSTSYARVRKLEIRNYVQTGIVLCRAHEFLVTDNYVHHCDNGIWGSPTSGGVIRRNTFTDIMWTALGMNGAIATTVEENVILRYHLNPYKRVAWAGPALVCNASKALILRNNIFADAQASAVWEDCWGLGLLLYGNTIFDVDDSGFYIEAGSRGTVLQWNTVFDCGAGIGFRENWANTAFENYFFHNRSGVGIGTCDASRGVKCDTVMYNWLIDNGMGCGFAPNPGGEPAQIFDHNIYKFQGLARRGHPHAQARGREDRYEHRRSVDGGQLAGDEPQGPVLRPLERRDQGGQGRGVQVLRLHARVERFASVCGRQACPRATQTKVPPSSKERLFPVQSTAGEHQVALEFYHGQAQNLWKSCTFSWEPPGGTKGLVTQSVAFHREPGAADLRPGLKAEFYDIHNDPAPMDPTSKAIVLQYGNKQYTDLQTLRAEVGQEIHGKVVTEFDPTPLGLVTFRVPVAKCSWKPVPMFANPWRRARTPSRPARTARISGRRGASAESSPTAGRGPATAGTARAAVTPVSPVATARDSFVRRWPSPSYGTRVRSMTPPRYGNSRMIRPPQRTMPTSAWPASRSRPIRPTR